MAEEEGVVVEEGTTIADTMRDVWDEMTEEPEEIEEDEVEEPAEEEQGKAEGEAEEEGDVGEGEEDGESDDIGEEDDDEVEVERPYEPGQLAPLEHWSVEDKKVFSKLPEEAQEFLITKDKSFQSHYTKKFQEIADLRRAFDPVRADLEQFGISEADAARRLIGAHKMLMEKPAEGIRYIAESYGVDLGNLDAGTTEESAAMREVASLRQQMADRERAEYAARVAHWDKQINEFKGSHEHFETLEPDMERIATAYAVRGEPIPPLETLYETAAYANPVVRKRMLESQQAGTKEKQLEEKRRRAQKAKRASRTKVRDTAVAAEAKTEPAKTLRDALSETYDELLNT